jgi:peroxiredoxin
MTPRRHLNPAVPHSLLQLFGVAVESLRERQKFILLNWSCLDFQSFEVIRLLPPQNSIPKESSMRFAAAVFVITLLSAINAQAAEPMYGDGPQVGDSVPAIKGAGWVSDDGIAPEMKGKVVLIDFYFANCPMCNAVAPEVERLYQRYRKSGLVVVGPSLDAEATVQRYKTAHALSYPLLSNSSALARAYDVRTFPFLVLVGKDGKVLWRSNFKDETLNTAIESALKSRTPTRF